MISASRLYEPGRHCAVSEEVWNEQRVGSYIEKLATGILEARRADGCWPSELGDFPLSIYAGVAGIAWALDQLHQRGYFDERRIGLCYNLAESYIDLPLDSELFDEYQVPVSHSLYLGSAGVQLQMWSETGKASYLDSLEALILENQSHPWMENLWGAPSTMIVASHLLAATGEERFAELIRSGAAYLEERLTKHPDAGCQMWNIDLYGERTWLLGAGHGFVGNVFPIVKSAAAFEEGTRSKWRERILDTVVRTAEREGGMANWRQSIGNIRKGRDSMLVQQCHGAPGFIIALSSLMGNGHTQFDKLMLEAGELVWRAGPLNKYPGLCHGTAGNGYAFLKLFEKTENPIWLARARAFAMSSIEQHGAYPLPDADRSYSLWAGDAGLAIYLADCIDIHSDFPTLDYF